MANFDGIASHHWLLHGSPNGKNRAVGWIDDGGEVIDPVHPQIGDGEGGTFHVFWGQTSSASLLGQSFGLGRDHAQALAVGIANDTHHEAATFVFGKRDGDAYVDGAVLHNGITIKRSVEVRVLMHGQRRGPNQEVVDRQLDVAPGQLLVEVLSHRHQWIHVERHRDLIVRNGGLGFDQTARDDLPHVGKWHPPAGHGRSVTSHGLDRGDCGG